jgi:hypothetical protein
MVCGLDNLNSILRPHGPTLTNTCSPMRQSKWPLTWPGTSPPVDQQPKLHVQRERILGRDVLGVL